MVSVTPAVNAHNIHGSDGMGGRPDFPPAASSKLLEHIQVSMHYNLLSIILPNKNFFKCLKYFNSFCIILGY